MGSFPRWDIDTAGAEIKKKIEKEAKLIKTYVIWNSSAGLLWGSVAVYSTFVIFPPRNFVLYASDYLFSIFKLTAHIAILAMMGHPFQILYITQQVKFQMYLFNKYIEEVCSVDEGEKKGKSLVDDEKYQEEIKLRLKLLVRRHCEFKRYEN